MLPKGAWLLLVVGITALAAVAAFQFVQPPTTASDSEPVRHVFVIIHENKDYNRTFGAASEAPYLGQTLPSEGLLLTQYWAVGYRSLVNYIAMVSGQPPNNETSENCRVFTEFVGAKMVDGIVHGDGCVYPREVPTIADQLEAAGRSWRLYAEDMALAEPRSCRHPTPGEPDPWYDPSPTDQYATRHVPFVYFHSVIEDRERCEKHVVDLEELRTDLARVETTPNLSIIIPDLCSDGHEWDCPDGRPGGYESIDAFMQEWVRLIRASPAYQEAGLVVATFDESETREGGVCCLDPAPHAGFGGGRIGTVLLAPCLEAGSEDATAYNHYGLLRTMEDLFDLPYLGFAHEARAIDLAGCASPD